MFYSWPLFFLFVFCLQESSQFNFDHGHRSVRQIGLGGLLNPTNNQGTRRVPSCDAPQKQKGRCLPMDQCVLRELDEDYIKYKGYLCVLGSEGPVGVCCPNSITKPVPYREGMFGNKYQGRSDTDTEETGGVEPTTRKDTELL